jgi:hypothetical protein
MATLGIMLTNVGSSRAVCFTLTVRVANLGYTPRAYLINDQAARYRPDKREFGCLAIRFSLQHCGTGGRINEQRL